MLWGAALGIQESTLRAAIADLIPRSHRAAAIGGALAGLLYSESLTALVVVTATIQVTALLFFAVFLARRKRQLAAAPDESAVERDKR